MTRNGRAPPINRAVRQALQGTLPPVSQIRGNTILSGLNAFYINIYRRAGLDAKLRRVPEKMGPIGARHHSFCGNAARVDAGASKQLALDDRDSLPGRRKTPCKGTPCKGWTRLAGPDYNSVVRRGHGCYFARCANSDNDPEFFAAWETESGKSLSDCSRLTCRKVHMT